MERAYSESAFGLSGVNPLKQLWPAQNAFPSAHHGPRDVDAAALTEFSLSV